VNPTCEPLDLSTLLSCWALVPNFLALRVPIVFWAVSCIADLLHRHCAGTVLDPVKSPDNRIAVIVPFGAEFIPRLLHEEVSNRASQCGVRGVAGRVSPCALQRLVVTEVAGFIELAWVPKVHRLFWGLRALAILSCGSADGGE